MTVWLGHSPGLPLVRDDLRVAKSPHHPSAPEVPMVALCPAVPAADLAPGTVHPVPRSVHVVRNVILMARQQHTCLLLHLCLLLDLHLDLHLFLDLLLHLHLHLHLRLPALPLCLALCISTRCPPEQWW